MDFLGAVYGLFLVLLMSCGVENSSVFRNKLIFLNPAVSLKWSENSPIDYHQFRADFIISEEQPVSFENEVDRPKFR